MINKIKLITLITTIFPVLSSCSDITTIKINHEYPVEDPDIGTINVYHSDPFPVNKKQRLNFTLSYENVSPILRIVGATFIFLADSDEAATTLIDVNHKISVTYNNHAMTRYDGTIAQFSEFIDDNPMSAKNMFAFEVFLSSSNDPEPPIGTLPAIALYYPYKSKKDKISVSFTSGTKANEVTAVFIDGILI